MGKMIRPYLCITHNNLKLFRINPIYSAFFKYLGIETDSIFFKANPIQAGLHIEYTSGDDQHWQCLKEYPEKINGEVYYFVSKNNTVLSGIALETTEAIENYLQSEVAIWYVLHRIEEDNEYARLHYKQAYIPGLKEKIMLYRKENNITEK